MNRATRTSEAGAHPQGLPPGKNRALVWGLGVGFPLIVAVMVFVAESPIDLTNPMNWGAAAVWILLAVAVCLAILYSKTPLQQRLPVILLVIFMLAIVQQSNASSGLSPFATAIAFGFWGFFLGIAFADAYAFGVVLHLAFCRSCKRYLWMARIAGGRQCPSCKTIWPATSVLSSDLAQT